MDKSDTYIKLCKEAEEIQRLRYKGKGNILIDIHPEWYKDGVLIKKLKLSDFPPSPFNWADGDFYNISEGQYTWCNSCGDEYGRDTTDFIWLPRQDQLQEIIRNLKNVSDYGLVHRMNHFVYGEDGESDFTEEAQKCHSMEQLWISFVMKENGKTWDGEKWVEI